MLDWLININKEYPDFWKYYLSKFDKKSNRYVVIATETTGLHLAKDVIVSIGSFSIVNNAIHIGDSFETVVSQYVFFHNNGISNEFSLETKMKKMTEPEALEAFIDYLGNSILVGYHINFQVEMINIALNKVNCGRLKNEALDVEIMHQKLIENNAQDFSLETLLETHKISQNDSKSSSNTAYKIALLFLRLKSKLGIN